MYCWLLRELLAASLILANKRFTLRTISKHREFLCKWKDYPLYESSWIKEKLLKNAREVLSQYLTPSVVPSLVPPAVPPVGTPYTTLNLNPTHTDICQVICCGGRATVHHPACKILPPSLRCSRHTLVACKEATSCRCSLSTDPPVATSSRD